MEPSIEIISEPSELGEGPFWDKITQSLYFVDILKSAIHKYVPKTGVLTSAKVGDKSVSIIIPIKDQNNRFLISYGPDLATITWDGKSENVSDLEIIAEIDPRRTNRLNDGKISPHGAVFVGSMATEKVDGKYDTHKGSFYCYTNNQIVELIPDVSISNGLAWTPDGSKLYYIDTFRFAVTRFDCDVTKRPILSNETIVYKHSIEGAVLNGPDGMTIDNEGKLWIAIFGLSSSQVRRIDPDTGEIISTVTLPLSPNVTSVTFGGADLDELYVTSAYCDLSEEERKENPNAGCLFKITGLGVRGTENLPFELKR